MQRRAWLKQVAIITLAGPALLELEGCTPAGIAKLEAWINIGLMDFEGIVAIVNPLLGSALDAEITLVNAAWAAVQAAITAYQKAPAADKTTFLGKVSIVVNALMGQLANLLGLIPGAAEYAATVKAALLLIISTLQAIAIGLPSTTAATAARIAIATLVLPPAPRNVGDFQAQFNQILVSGGYPPVV